MCTDTKKHKPSKTSQTHLFRVFLLVLPLCLFHENTEVGFEFHPSQISVITCTYRVHTMYIPYTKKNEVLKVLKNLSVGVKKVAARFCGNALNGYCGFVVVYSGAVFVRSWLLHFPGS